MKVLVFVSILAAEIFAPAWVVAQAAPQAVDAKAQTDDESSEPIAGPLAETEGPADSGALYTVKGAQFLELFSEPGADSRSLYRARPGEVFRVSQHASHGWRVVDGFAANSSDELEIKTPLFVQDDSKSIEGAAAKKGLAGHLDLEDGDKATVYGEPGKNPGDCAKNPQLCSQVVGSQAVSVVDAKLVRAVDESGEMGWKNYYKVTLANGKSGWLPSEVVLVGSSMPIPIPPIPPDALSCRLGNPQGNLQDLSTAGDHVSKGGADLIAHQLAPEMGKCLIDPPNRVPSVRAPANAFDIYVGGYWKAHPSSRVVGPNGPLKKPELEAIDALARTIYGEMGICREAGSHYLAAVAAVVHNRADYIESHPDQRVIFAHAAPSSDRLPITDVVTSPMQFSVWNNVQNKFLPVQQNIRSNSSRKKTAGSKRVVYRQVAEPNQNLRQVLCPPAQENTTFWSGHPASPIENEIWTASLKIATEAVLFPEQFAKRSSGVKALYYTSGLGEFRKGFVKESASIDGRALSNPSCIELWGNPKGVGH